MNQERLYDACKKWKRISTIAAIAACVGVATIFTGLASESRFTSGGGFGLLLASVLISVVCAKKLDGNPLRYHIHVLEKWLELGLGNVEEFPLAIIDRQKTLGEVEEQLVFLVQQASAEENQRNRAKAKLAEADGEQVPFSSLPQDRVHRTNLEQRRDRLNKDTQDAFDRYHAIWDFYSAMGMLPRKSAKRPGKQGKIWPDPESFRKHVLKEARETSDQPAA